MNLPKCLAAHTDLASPYPAFLSINEIAGDRIEIHMRSAPRGLAEGAQASIILPVDEFLRTFKEALNNYGVTATPKPQA